MLSPHFTPYSDRKLFTGLANAAFSRFIANVYPRNQILTQAWPKEIECSYFYSENKILQPAIHQKYPPEHRNKCNNNEDCKFSRK